MNHKQARPAAKDVTNTACSRHQEYSCQDLHSSILPTSEEHVASQRKNTK